MWAGSPACSRARSSTQVSGQGRLAATTSTSQVAAASCHQISHGHRHAAKPPSMPRARNAKCAATAAYSTASHMSFTVRRLSPPAGGAAAAVPAYGALKPRVYAPEPEEATTT
jgi:hypothetical protein